MFSIAKRGFVACAAAAFLTFAAPSAVRAQTSPFLPDDLYRTLVNEISGDRAYENVRHLSHFHRVEGSKDYFAANDWVLEAAKDAGLEDVKLIHQKNDNLGWTCASGEAWLVPAQGAESKLAAYGEVAVSIADNSRTTHVVADLVDVGAGNAERDYQGKDVKGKVVLASGPLGPVHQEAVWKRGALGVLSYQSHRPEAFDAPDQVAWSRIPYAAKGVAGVKDGTPATFAVLISPRRARLVQTQLEAGPARIRVDIESSFQAQGEQVLVEGFIRGSEIHDQQIVLTAHTQEGAGANDDASGCGNTLEIARALTRLIKDGKIPRPRRDLRFWWVNEFASEERYFRENPQEPRKLLLDLNQDMVGARQSLGGRVQYGARLPWSIPHVLEDVMESVLGTVSAGNTSLLTTRGTALPVPFTREITAVKGSREPYHARMVPYYNSTDHHAFTPAHIGVPATSLTNWPDEFIHSTGDDIDQLDATQLERNAVVVAAVALFFGSAGDGGLPLLASYSGARGVARLAADGATAQQLLFAGTDRAAAYQAARNLIVHSARKERGAQASIPRLGSASPAPAFKALQVGSSAAIDRAEAAQLQSLDLAYATLGGKPGSRVFSADEKALAARTYSPGGTIAEIQDGLERIDNVPSLHSMMRFEVLNFANGKRSGLDVYDAVSAEAASAGEWYYGKVSAADVKTYLENAVKAGVLKGAPRAAQ